MTKKLAKIIAQNQHRISRTQISQNIINILETIKKAGFSAYIVGGGVRDLLLSHKPKDFDIATDATPEQVRGLFRNSRIIGRRFKLIHIFFGREIIEVATFRTSPQAEQTNNKEQPSNDSHLTVDGRIIRDNIYGSLDDDIWRRDFTINALYYDAIDEQITDYCNGYLDLNNHVIKMLGDPETRYREDPVRMLRAIRFAAKLDFTIEQKTLEPLKNYEFINLLDGIPRARLFEEYNKLFLTGHAEKSFYLLKKYKLLHKLFPLTATAKIEEQYPEHLSFLHAVLKSTDQRIMNNLPVNPAFLIAAFLWHPMLQEHSKLCHKKTTREVFWREAALKIIKKQNDCLAIPKRFTLVMEDIWYLQRLFMKPHPKSIYKAAYHSKFRAGFDFLMLRSELEPMDKSKLAFWKEYESSDEKKRADILDDYAEQF